MKWIGFFQELLSPIKVAPGQVIEMEDSDYEELRKQAKDGFLANLTLRPDFPLMWQSAVQKPASVCALVPCGHCMLRDGQGNWVCVKPMTKCFACNDTRSEVAARITVPAEAQKAFADNLKRICK